jgi:hypothetical protein
VWRADLSGDGAVSGFSDVVNALRVDAAGDVVVAGFLHNVATNRDFFVAKLTGASGTELWRTVIDGSAPTTGAIDGDGANAVAVDASGDVLAAGSTRNLGTERDFTVVKLAGATGAELWRRVVNGNASPAPDDAANAAIAYPNGDFLVGGFTTHRFAAQQLTVTKLAGGDGSEIWRRDVDGKRPQDSSDTANAVTLDPEGNAVAAGVLDENTASSGPRLAVVKLAEGVPGVSLVVRDPSSNPAGRRVILSVRTGPDPVVASPGGPADPTLGGATLEVSNPTTGETDVFSLPAANWRGLGTPPGYGGYDYVDTAQAAGPCTKVTIIGPGRASNQGPLVGIRARCKGAQIGFSLDEPTQGSLRVRLTTGAVSTVSACMAFGGTVRKDTSAAGGGTGVFRATGSPVPAPGLCP